jgi:hypothetical protein
MEWALASLATVTAALIYAVFLLGRRQRDFGRHLEQLRSTIEMQRQDFESQQGAPSTATPNSSPPLCDPLALIEQLSDIAALHDDQSLQNTAQRVSPLPAGIPADLFAADHKLLAISRLLDKGHSLPAIAARLNLPLGEVELLANTRN